MDLVPYVDRLRRELAAAAEAGGEQAQSAAQQLATVLESAVRLILLEALSAAADEITRDLAPGSVHIRLQGIDPTFVVSSPSGSAYEEPSTVDESGTPLSVGAGPGTARINLRLPEDLKARVEEAANRERLSVNTWLVRAAASALEPTSRRSSSGGGTGRFTGWVR